jgi:hypothetical protein
MSTRVLIVERPGQFRDSLMREVSQRGATAHVRDDAMEALAALERLAPQIVVVPDDPGPPGALGLCRLVQRKLSETAVYRIGEPSFADQLDERSLLLPRAVGVTAIAAAILEKKPEASPWATHRAWEGSVGSLELGPLLLAIETRWLTGRLLISRPGTEREIAFVRGMPVHAHSTVLAERSGVLGVRRGLLTEAQLDQALDVAHARGLRIGTALLELGSLDAPGLYTLLSAQLLEQLTAACNSGACHARFVLDQDVATRHPTLRLSCLTALLHAVAAMPTEDIERVLDELAERALAGEMPRPVERWLSDLQLREPGKLEITSVRVLRARLREALPPSTTGKPINPDVLTLALLRSGAFRMPEEKNDRPSDVRAGIRTLSPPSIVSAVVRCSHSAYDEWPVSALGRARSPLEQAIDECLHGKRPPEAARALALTGPEADCDPRYAEVYALTLASSFAQPQWFGGDNARPRSVSELRLRCHSALKRLDELEAEHPSPLARVHLLQMRAQVERALSMLPSPEQTLSQRPPEPAPPPPAPANDTAPRQVVAPAAPPPQPTAAAQPAHKRLDAAEISLLTAAEPLLQQARWRELRELIHARGGDPAQLPPVLALLYAIALKEDSTASPDQAKKLGHNPDALGIRVISQLLSLPEQSSTAVLIAKRLMRRRPLDWKQKPPGRISAILVMGALLAGALVGVLLHPWLLALLWK